MEGQTTIFDFMPRPDDPILNAIKHMTPYWTDSRQTIIDAYYSGKDFAKVVKHEYCPYGYSGHYGGDFGKKGVFVLTGWTMNNGRITFEYIPFKKESITWAKFADYIAELIRKDEFLKRR